MKTLDEIKNGESSRIRYTDDFLINMGVNIFNNFKKIYSNNHIDGIEILGNRFFIRKEISKKVIIDE